MTAISRYPVPELHDLPEDLRTRILEVQAKAGFVPNVFLALAHRPDEWRAFVAYHDALLLKETGSLTKGDLIVVWIGHGQRGPDGTLQLLGTKGRQVLASAGGSRASPGEVIAPMPTCPKWPVLSAVSSSCA